MHRHPQTLPLAQLIVALVFIMCATFLYFLPTFVAIRRKSPKTSAVVVLNVFLGFTFIGWIVALILASKAPQVIVHRYYHVPPQ